MTIPKQKWLSSSEHGRSPETSTPIPRTKKYLFFAPKKAEKSNIQRKSKKIQRNACKTCGSGGEKILAALQFYRGNDFFRRRAL